MALGSVLAIRSISFYQRYVSPRKGYACAYRVLHSDLSCSAYSKQAIEAQGLCQGIKSTLRRFQECKLAAQTIKEQREAVQAETKTKPSKKCGKLNACESFLVAEVAAEAACCICSNMS